MIKVQDSSGARRKDNLAVPFCHWMSMSMLPFLPISRVCENLEPHSHSDERIQ